MFSHLQKQSGYNKILMTSALVILLLFSFNLSYAHKIFSNYYFLGSLGGHDYYVSSGGSGDPEAKTWPAAKTAATNMGGYLATLTTQSENDFVYTQLVSYLNTYRGGLVPLAPPCLDANNHDCSAWGDNRHAWIGLNDGVTEGAFSWDNGENCTAWRNWDVGEPNNFASPNGAGEDYVELLAFTGVNHVAGANQEGGKWNDWFNEQTQTYIVEIGPYNTGAISNQNILWPPNHKMADVYIIYPPCSGDNCGVISITSNEPANSIADGNTDADWIIIDATHVQVRAERQGKNTASDGDGRKYLIHTSCGDIVVSVPHDQSGKVRPQAIQGNGLAENEAINKLNIRALSNPARGYFTLQLSSNSTDKVTLRVMDMQGKLIEQLQNIPSNKEIKLGNNYRPGIYFIEVTQGALNKKLKLVKSN